MAKGDQFIKIHVDIEPEFDIVAQRFRSVDIKSAIQEGLEAFAFEIEGESKKNSPIDTGRLRASITTDIGNLKARVSPHVDYAGYVHEGTKRMRARPFMAIGLSRAEAKMYNGKGPFSASLEKEMQGKIL